MIDITKLLKDCPKGTKLYSPLFGEVKFKYINGGKFGIVVEDSEECCRSFDKYGRYFAIYKNAECLLFPSEHCRTWEGWKAPTKPKFDVGNWIIFNNYFTIPIQIIGIREKDDIYVCRSIEGIDGNYSISSVDSDYHLWTVNDAKPGDILVDNVEGFKNPLIFILKKFEHVNYGLVKPSDYSSYCFLTASDNPKFKEGHFHHMHDIKPATQKQKDLLFSKMDEAGYTWDLLYKELVRKTKFKVGDWITDGSCKVKITAIDNTYYWFSNNCIVGEIESIDKKYHIWSVDDAKPGDILCYKDEISLFKTGQWECDSDKFIGFEYYCCYDGKILVTNGFYSLTEKDKSDIQPASEKQIETLLSYMASAGYIWDSNNKTLKKSKFKIWDWIINNKDKRASQITEIICDEKDPNTLYGYVHTNGFFANDFEDNYHLWTIKDAKDGDVLVSESNNPFIYNGSIEFLSAGAYVGVSRDETIKFDFFPSKSWTSAKGVKPATKEQREILFVKIKAAGYEWDADEKKLRKIQPHYDISNFHEGMPVLVREYDTCVWQWVLYSHFNGVGLFFAAGKTWRQCIPFEGNEHLLGTTNPCDERFINW